MSRPLVPKRGFDQLEVGEQYPCPARTLTDAHFSAFQLLSGDNHPIHYDRPYCAAQTSIASQGRMGFMC